MVTVHNVLQGDPNNWVDTDKLFIIGTGYNGGVRSNAFVVNKNWRCSISVEIFTRTRCVDFPGPRGGGIIAGTGTATFGGLSVGGGTVASGTAIFAAGTGTASGYYSSAIGNGALASGSASMALGYSATASGNYATAFGANTTAQGYDQFVIGQYNVPQGAAGVSSGTNALFVIGNGTSSGSPSDAVIVLQNGNVGIGTTSPDELFEVNSSALSVAHFKSTYGTGESYIQVDSSQNSQSAILGIKNTGAYVRHASGSLLRIEATGGGLGTLNSGVIWVNGGNGTGNALSINGSADVSGNLTVSNALLVSGTTANPNKISNGGLIVTGTTVAGTVVASGSNQSVLIPYRMAIFPWVSSMPAPNPNKRPPFQQKGR